MHSTLCVCDVPAAIKIPAHGFFTETLYQRMASGGTGAFLAEELKPKPLQLKKKPRGIGLEDLEPAENKTATGFGREKCAGKLYGHGVLVTELQDIWALVKLGAYGKGMFSRSVPSHWHIPSHEELKRSSRKRRGPVLSAGEVEESWRKRAKLHSAWRKEDTAVISEEEGVSTTGDCSAVTSHVTEGSGDAGDDDYQEFVSRLKAIREKDPYAIEEYLQLGAEEAYYLVAEIDILSVKSDKGETLTSYALWLHFASLSRSFCSRYAAYSHYRAGNWVPKSGLKYGVDFVLYKESPLTYHSSFAVVVREGRDQSHLTWRDVVALNRASESSGKDLLVCSVTWPQAATEDPERTPSAARVSDIFVKRWVPKKDR